MRNATWLWHCVAWQCIGSIIGRSKFRRMRSCRLPLQGGQGGQGGRAGAISHSPVHVHVNGDASDGEGPADAAGHWVRLGPLRAHSAGPPVSPALAAPARGAAAVRSPVPGTRVLLHCACVGVHGGARIGGSGVAEFQDTRQGPSVHMIVRTSEIFTIIWTLLRKRTGRAIRFQKLKRVRGYCVRVAA